MYKELIGQVVVLDMATPYVIVGTLQQVSQSNLSLKDVDVHDLRDSTTTREVYVRELRLHGVAANRKSAIVRLDQIVSVSLLTDVLP